MLQVVTKTILLLLPFILPPFATARDFMASGTIIVIAQTKDRVIMAADSRSRETTDGTPVKSTDDNECKIAAFGRICCWWRYWQPEPKMDGRIASGGCH
jgi:hypothetical protein